MTSLPAWAELIIGISVLLTAIATIRRYVWPAMCGLYRIIRTIEQGAKDYQQSGGFAGLYKELHPNGGGSLRDAVDRGREEAQAAAAEARKAVAEATRIGEITEELRGHAMANREGIADLRDQNNDHARRLTDIDEKIDAQGQRITDHRRRNDEQIKELRDYLENDRDDILLAKQALEASVTELLNIDDPDP